LNDTQIIDAVLRREGSSFTDDPKDRGGATKYGITQSAWAKYITAKLDRRAYPNHVRDLTEANAREFYKTEYCDAFAWVASSKLRALVIDCAINHGTYRTVRWVQIASGLPDDGIVGPQTRAAFEAPRTFGEYVRHDTVYAAVLKTRFQFYAQIATDQANDPDVRFLRGWIARACEFIR
jgi:lysozyme family protein